MYVCVCAEVIRRLSQNFFLVSTLSEKSIPIGTKVISFVPVSLCLVFFFPFNI